MATARRSAVAVALAAVALATGSLVSGSGAGAAPKAPKADTSVHINQIQVIGSHNSYHQLPSAPEVALRHSILGQGDEGMTYQHQPLPFQFQSEKVRQIELDVFLDPKGGKYANPLLRSAAGVGPYSPEMDKPGIKVLHIQDVDYATSCLTLQDCLGQIESWSTAHPSHAPIAILMELKDDEVTFPGFEFVHPDKFDAAAMDTLDAEIRKAIPADQLITPDDVRGSHATLNEAVTTDGWPTLESSRGKVMFLMDNGGDKRKAYLQGHPSLEGRVLFTNANPGDPDAGFVERNDAKDPSIPGLVKAGYMVRTRADGDTNEARDNDTSARDAALASGAQWVSTDYPVPGMAIGFTSPYFAEIPGGTVARCNPVNGPASCSSSALDTNYTPADLPPLPPGPVDPTPTTVPTSDTTTPATEPSDGVTYAPAATPVSGSPAYTG